jgi:glutamyl-Q tRNA(Asp) synthetase
MLSQPVFRFAPSPNGYLHLGHAYSALLNQKRARESGGRFLLRIEDIDLQRARSEFEQAIYDDLEWLGISWERPVRRQSEHIADYAAALNKLKEMELLFACDCTRASLTQFASSHENWPRDPDNSPLYSGACLTKMNSVSLLIEQNNGFALRLNMSQALKRLERQLYWQEYSLGNIAADPGGWGDVILSRKSTPASYHIAVVVDDALQGVTDVVRGRDLYAATSVHRLLQHLLGLLAPNYHHHELIYDAIGAKLSKSQKSISLRALRAEGMSAQAVKKHLGF